MKINCKNCGHISLVVLEFWGMVSGLTPLICPKCDYTSPVDIVVEKVTNSLDFGSPIVINLSATSASVFSNNNPLDRARLL